MIIEGCVYISIGTGCLYKAQATLPIMTHGNFGPLNKSISGDSFYSCQYSLLPPVVKAVEEEKMNSKSMCLYFLEKVGGNT